MDDTMRVAVIGGGASGLAAAICAARAGASVCVFESARRVGQRLLKTGNGRCNLTNMHVHPADYHEPSQVAPLIEAYPAGRVLDFFEGLGLLTVEEDDGRVYPLSNNANTVLDVLRAACARHGVEELCGHEVTNICACDDGFEIACANGGRVTAGRVIVATGGGTSLLAGLGHEVVPFSPALCPLKTDTAALKGLSGVRAYAKVSAYDSADEVDAYAWLYGELLFRDYGLSGIVIFDMSREIDPGDYLGIDFVPQLTVEQYAAWLAYKHEAFCGSATGANSQPQTYAKLMCGDFHTRINDAIIKKAGCRPSDDVRPDALPVIAQTAKDFRVQVTGHGDVSQAQVMRGGAAMDEFDPLTLESRLHAGLFAAGETLDVDGRCGGFNLHWAWASGIAAGTAAAAQALE